MCQVGVDAALTVMERLEKSASKLYKLLYYTFDTKDDEAAFLFYRMHLEEKTHGLLVQYLRRMTDKIEIDIAPQDTQFCVLALKNYADKIDELIEEINLPSVEVALALALQLEEGYSALYKETVKKHFKHPAMMDLVGSLTEASHIENLKSFIKGRSNKWH